MKKAIIKEGDRFGRLVAIRFDHRNKQSNQYWLFGCDCGKKKIVYVNSVKTGKTKSCGCLSKEITFKRIFKHGMCESKIYCIHRSMKARCLNPNNPKYYNYGGRGITICKEWLKFENFYKDMGERPSGKSLDRIKNDKGYCKSNCKWSNLSEQNNNTRRNHLISYQSKTQTIAEWAEELRVDYNVLWSRINRGNRSIKEALSFIK